MDDLSWSHEAENWRYRCRPGRNGVKGWIAFAKRGCFVSEWGHEIFEPGDLWFEFGTTEDEALAKLQAEVCSMMN
jgi:hypothetical protein